MDILLNILGIAFVGVIAYQVITIILYHLFFLPYRNRFMKWYMKRFNKNYLAAKQIFDELLTTQEECRRSAKIVQTGYYQMLQIMQEDKRFRSTEDFREFWEGKKEPKDIATVLSGASASTPDFESFVCFYGKGINWHKVEVFFEMGNEDGIWLRYIRFFYHEESKQFDSFYFPLEQKKFDPDPDSGNRNRKVHTPVPSITIEKPDLVTA